MFKVNEYLEIKKECNNDVEVLVENCGSFEAALHDYCVVLPKSNLEKLLTFVETELQNPTYCLKLLQKNTSKGLDLLKNTLKISSYTVEFIKHYDGVQSILDLFKPTPVMEKASSTDTISKESAKPAPLNFSIGAVVDNAGSFATVYDEGTPKNLSDEKVDVYKEQDAGWVKPENDAVTDNTAEETTSPVTTEEVEVSAETVNSVTDEEIKTEEILENSHNNESSQVPAVMMNEMNDMMLLMRAMAAKMGIVDDNSADVMNEDDIATAKIYVNEMAASTVRDAVIGVLDRASSKEELNAITVFMSMFISYMREV